MTSSLEETQMPGCDYNFFQPNLCHVCKFSNQSYVAACTNCSMISYCSEQHRMQHLPQHKEICEAIQEISKTKNLWLTRRMTKDEWIKHKKEMLQAVQLILNRSLKLYEKQMFLFAKSCNVCHQQSNLKVACGKCLYVNTCDDHKSINTVHQCVLLKRALLLDIYYFSEKQDVKILPNHLPKTMEDIVGCGNTKEIVERFKQCEESATEKWRFVDYVYSDSISGPLTLFDTMLNFAKFKQQKRTFVIHIIAGSMTDLQSLSAWEIVLHLLLPGTKLTIIYVESRINGADFRIWDVCEECRTLKKTLYFEMRGTSYEHYVQCSFHVAPNIVIGFHADLEKLGASIMRVLQRQECPLLLTSASAKRAEYNMKKLNEMLGTLLAPITTMDNKFRSWRPYRDLEDEISFPNNGVLFYDQLLDTTG